MRHALAEERTRNEAADDGRSAWAGDPGDPGRVEVCAAGAGHAAGAGRARRGRRWTRSRASRAGRILPRCEVGEEAPVQAVQSDGHPGKLTRSLLMMKTPRPRWRRSAPSRRCPPPPPRPREPGGSVPRHRRGHPDPLDEPARFHARSRQTRRPAAGSRSARVLRMPFRNRTQGPSRQSNVGLSTVENGGGRWGGPSRRAVSPWSQRFGPGLVGPGIFLAVAGMRPRNRAQGEFE
jgi:hypothetical protein